MDGTAGIWPQPEAGHPSGSFPEAEDSRDTVTERSCAALGCTCEGGQKRGLIRGISDATREFGTAEQHSGVIFSIAVAGIIRTTAGSAGHLQTCAGLHDWTQTNGAGVTIIPVL